MYTVWPVYDRHITQLGQGLTKIYDRAGRARPSGRLEIESVDFSLFFFLPFCFFFLSPQDIRYIIYFAGVVEVSGRVFGRMPQGGGQRVHSVLRVEGGYERADHAEPVQDD